MRQIRNYLGHLFRFAIVGAINTLSAFSVFAVLLWAGVHFTLATFIGGMVGVFIGFRLHGSFVFKQSGDGRFMRFVSIFILMYLLNIGIQAAARSQLNAYISGALASGLTIPISYFFNRRFVFHRDSSPIA